MVPFTVTETVAPFHVVGKPAPALEFKVTGGGVAVAMPVPKIVKIVLGEMPEFGKPLGV